MLVETYPTPSSRNDAIDDSDFLVLDWTEAACRGHPDRQEECGHTESWVIREGRDAHQHYGGNGSETQRHYRVGSSMDLVVWERTEVLFEGRGLGVHWKPPHENRCRTGRCA